MSPIVTTMSSPQGRVRRPKGSTPPAALGIPVSFVRFDSGTATTFYDWALELAQGELTAANIANVSVWMNGTEIPVYAEALGRWPDGSARTLYLQAEQTGTQDTEIPGDVRLTGGFTQARRSYTDRTDRWINKAFTVDTAYTANDPTITIRNNLSYSVTLNATSTLYYKFGFPGFLATAYNINGEPITINAGSTATLTFTSTTINASIAAGDSIFVVTGSNEQSTPAPYRDAGFPEGVIVSTDPTRLCAATGSGYLMPQATETVFTENGISSSDANTQFETWYPTTGLRMVQSANYERGLMMWHKYCRTGNLRYLKDFCGYTSAKREHIYSGYVGASAEWEYENLTKALMYLFRKDTVIGDRINSDGGTAAQGINTTDDLRGTAARSVIKQTAMLWMGNGTGPSGVELINWVANTQVPKYLADLSAGGFSTYLFDNNRPISSSGTRDIHNVFLRFTYPYMAGLYLHALQALHDALPSSQTTARTNIAAKVSAAIDYLNGSGLLNTIGGTTGLPGFEFTDVDVYFNGQSNPIEVMSAYTAGAGTISLKNNSASTISVQSQRCLSLAGTDSAVSVTQTGWAAGETRTVTLTSPFTQSHAAGVTGLAWTAIAASAGGGGTADLNGFWPHVYAWDWWVNGDTDSRDKAKQFYCSLGVPSGNGGPAISFAGKQFSEAHHLSQQTPAILAKRA